MIYHREKIRKARLFSAGFFAALTILSILLFPAISLAEDTGVYNIVLTPGRTEKELYFTWQSPGGSPAETKIQLALKSDMSGADFPADKARTLFGTAEEFSDGLLSHKAAADGLIPDTAYVYRLGTGEEWSDAFGFSTANSKEYSFLLVADAQIGAGNYLDEDLAAWTDSLDKALLTTPDAAFILSVGDQVDLASAEEQYDAFLSPAVFKSVPFAPAMGNHDNNSIFFRHFNLPNADVSQADGNYYFSYGGALFIVLNSNTYSYDRYEELIRDAVKSNPKAAWRIAVMHHSIYGSAAVHSTFLDLRANLVPVFDKYHIDAVLSGHDHTYARSHFMFGDTIQPPVYRDENQDGTDIPEDAVIKPEGTLYLALGTTSGTKYYDTDREFFEYLAERGAPYAPMFSQIDISENVFRFTVYKTDDMSVIDSLSMVKAVSPGEGAPPLIPGLIIIGVLAGIAVAVYVRRSKSKHVDKPVS